MDPKNLRISAADLFLLVRFRCLAAMQTRYYVRHCLQQQERWDATSTSPPEKQLTDIFGEFVSMGFQGRYVRKTNPSPLLSNFMHNHP